MDEEQERIQRYADRLISEYMLNNNENSIELFMDLRGDLKYAHGAYLLGMDDDIRNYIERKNSLQGIEEKRDQIRIETKEDERTASEEKKAICVVYDNTIRIIQGANIKRWDMDYADMLTMATGSLTIPAEMLPEKGKLILVTPGKTKLNLPGNPEVKRITPSDYYAYLWFANGFNRKHNVSRVAIMEYDDKVLYVSGYYENANKPNGYEKMFDGLQIAYNRTRGHIMKDILEAFNQDKKDRDKVAMYMGKVDRKHLNTKLEARDVEQVDTSWENIIVGNEEQFDKAFQDMMSI